jgi:hypothetical protein
MIYLLVAEALALILGWMGHRSLPGKIAVGGVCLLVVWSLVTYILFLSQRPPM